MLLYVGLTSVVGHIKSYADRFDLLELRFDPARPPSPKSLRKLRGSAPEQLLFSLLVVPKLTAAGLENPENFGPVLEAADALKARWIVLQTGSDIGPSQRSRSRLAVLAARCAVPGRYVGWEPRGPWEPEVAREAAVASHLVLVEDLSMVEAPCSGIVYTRLRVPGPGAALRTSALEKLSEQIVAAEECFVVIEGRGSGRARSRIEQALGAAVSALEDEDEDDLEEELQTEGGSFSANLQTQLEGAEEEDEDEEEGEDEDEEDEDKEGEDEEGEDEEDEDEEDEEDEGEDEEEGEDEDEEDDDDEDEDEDGKGGLH